MKRQKVRVFDYFYLSLSLVEGNSQDPAEVQNFGTEPRAYVHRQSFWTEI